jgi:hypothetical protein
MKKWIGFLVFCFVLQGIGWAQLIDAKSAAGLVTALKGNTITINENNHELVLAFTEATHFLIGPDLKAAGDIHVGDRVTAVYREKGAQKTALSITVSSKK